MYVRIQYGTNTLHHAVVQVILEGIMLGVYAYWNALYLPRYDEYPVTCSVPESRE